MQMEPRFLQIAKEVLVAAEEEGDQETAQAARDVLAHEGKDTEPTRTAREKVWEGCWKYI